MTQKTLREVLACFLVLVPALRIQAAELSTDDFRVVQKKVTEFSAQFGANKVLLVCDIDNTLLAMNQDLGSNQWFEWQLSLLGKDPAPAGRVAKDFAELYRAQSLLFALGGMHPPQSDLPQIIVEIQKSGVITMAHTSRGADMRDVTLREFNNSKYSLGKTTINPKKGFAGRYLPYDTAKIAESGLSKIEAEKLIGTTHGKIKPARLVSFNQGIYMTAGQHKGAMLRMLLHKSGNTNRFKAIVFVDDTAKNTKAVRDAFVTSDVTAVTYLYTRENKNVREFEENVRRRRDLTIQQWNRLKFIRRNIFRKSPAVLAP